MTEMAETLIERRGGFGVITLNRPKALNALTLDQIREIDPRLKAWNSDPEVRAVLICGAGEKAFCAGGDVAALWKDRAEGLDGPNGAFDPLTAPEDSRRRRFFHEEYTLNRRIFRFSKPFVALNAGVTMGGGVGLSAFGSHRIATDTSLIAMPETAIGLFPDVGGHFFLPRMPGEIGTYLALSGARCKGGADAVHTGFASHHVPSDSMAAFVDALLDADLSDDARAAVDAVVDRFAADPGDSALAAEQEKIDRCFAFDSVEEIMAALAAESGEWAAETRARMEKMSPLAMKVTLRQLRLGADMEFDEGMVMEYRLSQWAMAGREFYEGIRSVLIDKDRSPKWEPARLEEVTEDMVASQFAPLGDRDLAFED